MYKKVHLSLLKKKPRRERLDQWDVSPQVRAHTRLLLSLHLIMCSKSAFVPFLIWHVKSLAFWLCASWLLALQSKLSLWGNWSLWRFPWWWMNSETCVHACVCVFRERLARIGAWWQDSLSSCEVRRGLRSVLDRQQ